MDLETYLADLRARQERVRPADTPREVAYPLGEVVLPAHVEHWARTDPRRPAIVFGDDTLTYADLDDAHRRLAGWMHRHGVGAGDRVAVYLGNSPQFVVAFLAILRLGAVHVPVNPMFQPAELAYEINDSTPRVIVTSTALSATVDRARDRIGDVPLLLVDGPEWGEALAVEPYDGRADDLDALAALNYTGGTTGLPKGCQHTQRHMVYTAASAAGAAGYEPGAGYVSLCYLPIFWIAGEDLGILLPIVLGGTVVLMPRWDATAVLESIERHGVKVVVGTVENYLELLDHPQMPERDLSSLSDPQAVSFIRKLTPEVRARWAEAVPGSVLRESSYGMTETHTIDCVPYGFAADDHDLRAEPVFCGVPVPGTDIAVVSFETAEPLPIGEVGEIIVRSPSVTTGYWNNPEATAAQLRDGWIHTGDNGRFDEEGCLHYLGRAKEMIKVKGMSVFPAEIEMMLAQHPAVDSAAVVPTDDPDTGQRPVAFVTVREPVDAATLTTWARENMAGYKVPVVSVIDAFPMTATGKIRKNELAEAAREAVAVR
ncbi:long-chain acyl-CoA synthetase [Mumia flava]|uniref:Long-chain acyl-CoA synthetase n=1 Tax=Mumia flava TaxID=1348852 RepID=A0A0B2BF50_9ACTN|nr:AMP-binding protein [Mumia flava]PJJ57422.1 long-chain acyl-CoA synthetase [Mumia flava]